MEIKRKFEQMVITKRRFVIRRITSVGQTTCAECGDSMLAAESAAVYFGITQRRIFQIIETGAAHYTETEAGALLICLTSLANFVETDERR